MQLAASLSSVEDILPLRTRYREEMNCQIVHDSIHRRKGWSLTYRLDIGGVAVGYGSVAIAGPWTGKPTVFEFYVLPEHQLRAFDLFDTLLAASGARFFEVQTNSVLLTVMLHAYGRDIASEKIVFRDKQTTTHASNGAILRRVTSDEETRNCLEQRQGGGEWLLELDETVAATGGILFHYNRPFGDIYMDVAESFRLRGLGTYLVQELKRVCYELDSIPCARCNPTNIASRQTLQKAGFVPYAHILNGSIPAA